jgi:hypothetical protein
MPCVAITANDAGNRVSGGEIRHRVEIDVLFRVDRVAVVVHAVHIRIGEILTGVVHAIDVCVDEGLCQVVHAVLVRVRVQQFISVTSFEDLEWLLEYGFTPLVEHQVAVVPGHGALEQLVPQRYFDAVAGVRADHDGLDSRGSIPDTVTLGAFPVGRRNIGKRLALVVLAIAVEVLIRLRWTQRHRAGRQGMIDVSAISCPLDATGVI